MASSTYDLLVIGAGAAGGAAAHTAAEKGARVAQVERDKIGGTCLNYGCDPTKTLLHTARMLYRARHSDAYGLLIPLSALEWRAAQDHVHRVVNQMRGGTEEEAAKELDQQGIEFLHGEAHFVSPHEIAVNGRILAAERAILAQGTRTLVPPVEGLQEAGFLTNESVLALSELPGRMAVVGGGAIGIEFAQMFQRFGMEITVLDRGPAMLDTEDQELARKLCSLLSQEGIKFVSNAELRQVQRVSQGKRLVYKGEQGDKELVVDEILVVAGRRPTLENLNLDRIGVKTSKKGVEVDEYLRTSVPHIWAAGDVTGGYKFTHVANEQGRLAAQNAFAEHPRPFDDSIIPWVTFTDPPLAHVGPTEEELRQQGRQYRVARMEFKKVERALTLGQTEGLIKLLVDAQGHILGGHILGPRADDLIAPVVVAMRAGMPASELAATVLPYPTLSEGIRWAASSLS